MIDNCTVEVDMDMSPFAGQTIFEYHGLTFIPRFSSSGEIYQYDADLKNLKIKFKPLYNKCLICNSFHKFLDGFNYTDFTMTKLKTSITEISDFLGLDVSSGKIKKIEYGCNLVLPEGEVPYNKLVSYNGKKYRPEYSKNKVYGRSCNFTNYAIKGYNKRMQVKAVDKIDIPDNIFRWEVKVTSMNSLYKRKNPISIEKVSDLFDLNKAQSLCDDAVSKYNDSIKNYQPDLNKCSIRQITAYARMSNEIASDALCTNNLHTYYGDQRLYKKMMKAAKSKEDILGKLLEDKFHDLINS